MQIRLLGMMPYREAWELQEELRAARAQGMIPDTLLLCEHPPVFTIGRRDCRADWRATFETIARAGIEVIQVNRGGRITYHGPGQLVGYCIVDLPARRMGIRDFVTAIESLLIRTLHRFGVDGARDATYPGVWVGAEKIAAIGLHVRRGVTLHGFALNVSPRMEAYAYIVPCGLHDRGVTSLARVLKERTPSMEQVTAAVSAEIQSSEVLECRSS